MRAARATEQVERRVGALLDAIATQLLGAGVAAANDEARDILAALLDVPRFWPTMHRETAIDVAVIEDAIAAAARRAKGAPFAYAVGRSAFRYLTLAVDERVLIPRQETEVLVDLVLEATLQRPGGVAVDIGTGSGAIALALATEGTFDAVLATDISLGAVEVARANVRRLRDDLRCPVEVLHGALLAPVADQRARVIVSNPPYIAFEEDRELPPDVRNWEPPIALYSADNGLATTAALVRHAPDVLEERGVLALEVDTRRASLVAELCSSDSRYADVSVHLDLTGRERFVLARVR
jgi:release factor glutamine methyltransferase